MSHIMFSWIALEFDLVMKMEGSQNIFMSNRRKWGKAVIRYCNAQTASTKHALRNPAKEGKKLKYLA